MSESNVELVRRLFDEFNQGGPAAVITGGFLAAEIEFDATGADLPGIAILHGQDRLARFFEEDWFGVFPFDKWKVEIGEPIPRGDQVIVTSRQQGRGAGSGAPAVLELGNIFTISNGKITRLQIYVPPQEAFQAAGLSE